MLFMLCEIKSPLFLRFQVVSSLPQMLSQCLGYWLTCISNVFVHVLDGHDSRYLLHISDGETSKSAGSMELCT